MIASSRKKGIGLPKCSYDKLSTQTDDQNFSRTDSTISVELVNDDSLQMSPLQVNSFPHNTTSKSDNCLSLIKRQASVISCLLQQNKEYILLLKQNQEKHNKLIENYSKLLYLYGKMQEHHQKVLDSICIFLSEEQIEKMQIDKKLISQWTDNAIIKGLKMRFALGKHGYNYLRETGYPLPAYSTLNRRIQNVNIDFGILNDLLGLLKMKVQSMDVSDRDCCLSIDEMEILPDKDFDTSNRKFVGQVTLGDKTALGKHYLVILIRGLKHPWKQVIGHEVSGPSTDGFIMKHLICKTIAATASVGLRVRVVVSDMGSSNRAMWNTFGITVSKHEIKNYFKDDNGNNIYVMSDVPHLIKSIKNASLTQAIKIPIEVCLRESLPSELVSFGFIKELWISEINSPSSLCSLHHLSRNHLFPSQFAKMNVATAVQLFSPKTVVALEKAVSLKQLNSSALTTAWWVRLINEWFQVMTARTRKKAITLRNCTKKIEFLKEFVNIVKHLQIGKGWKPSNTGLILLTRTVINLAEECLAESYQLLLTGRTTQDALENVFS